MKWACLSPPPPPITFSDSSRHSRPPSPAGNSVQNDRVFPRRWRGRASRSPSRRGLAQGGGDMENFFGILAVVVALASLPCGFLLARRCTKSVGVRVLLTIVFGAVILVAGLIAVMAGCSGLGGKMDMR